MEMIEANSVNCFVLLNVDEREMLIFGYIQGTVENVPIDIVELIISFYGLIKSNLTSLNNPLTIRRLRNMKLGNIQQVHFDETVIVHSIPYFYPSRLDYWPENDESCTTGEQFGRRCWQCMFLCACICTCCGLCKCHWCCKRCCF
eukprot:461568_1